MDVCQMHDILWSRRKLSLQLWLTLTWVTGEFLGIIPTESQFTHDAHPLHYFIYFYQNKHIFKCISRVIAYNWWIWVILLIIHCYETSFLTWWLFCGFDILVALATSRDQNGSDCCGIHGEFDSPCLSVHRYTLPQFLPICGQIWQASLKWQKWEPGRY